MCVAQPIHNPTRLRRCFRAHHYQRACGHASWTSDREGHSTSARTAVGKDKRRVRMKSFQGVRHLWAFSIGLVVRANEVHVGFVRSSPSFSFLRTLSLFL